MNTDQLITRISGLSVVFWLAVVGFALAGCQSYQPPGADLWIAVGAGR